MSDLSEECWTLLRELQKSDEKEHDRFLFGILGLLSSVIARLDRLQARQESSSRQ